MDFTNLTNFMDHMAAEHTPGAVIEVYYGGKKVYRYASEFGWGGAAGAAVIVDPKINLGVFFAQHTLNPREGYYQPRLKNVVYSCL